LLTIVNTSILLALVSNKVYNYSLLIHFGETTMVNTSFELLFKNDPELASAMEKELKRQQGNIELIASENFVSPSVLAAAGSILTNKYAEGYPAHRYYGGCEYVDMVENIAIERAKKLFGAEYANVQPHSGSQANTAAYFALLNPGDTVMGMSLADGGHLTHGSPVNISGKVYNFIPYGVNAETGIIDYDYLEKTAHESKPKLIVAGASAYSRTIDFARISKIAKDVGAYFMVDMAHIAGLVATGLHPSPIPYADIVTTTTHKTLRGPRGGLILSREEFGPAINKAIFPGIQGGPLEHIVAAKAVAFGEALKPEFKTYQEQIIKNAKALEKTFREENLNMVSDGTDNHLILLDLRNIEGMSGKKLEQRLDQVHITANKNAIPNDPKSPNVTSGLRVGTPAVTTRGFKEEDMVEVGHLIGLAARHFKRADEIIERAAKLCEKYPLYK